MYTGQFRASVEKPPALRANPRDMSFHTKHLASPTPAHGCYPRAAGHQSLWARQTPREADLLPTCPIQAGSAQSRVRSLGARPGRDPHRFMETSIPGSSARPSADGPAGVRTMRRVSCTFSSSPFARVLQSPRVTLPNSLRVFPSRKPARQPHRVSEPCSRRYL